ncbi:F-box protein CPR1-like [Trifolium pratense]|uniref:F-box protein CPR1-like n=1 Tax=Trifolium pratense TaxID=57577 RepID=UPI001E694775|nr:F-box protein CPR1-like [Trifolium pratense]
MEKCVPMAAGKNEDLKYEVSNNNNRINVHIPDDIAFSILSKLPIKSLKRFGCVRKSWSLLFENPYFMNMLRNHFLYNNNRHCSDYGGDTFLFLYEPLRPHYYRASFYLLSNDKFEDRIKLDLPPPFDGDDIAMYILSSVSVNGIFCLGKDTRRGIVNSFQAALWNPATAEVMGIPPSPDESVPPYRDPFFIFHGFGYDNVKDDYKLIRYITFFQVVDEEEDVPYEDRSYDPLLQIYSLRSNSWRILDVNMPDGYDISMITFEKPMGVYMDEVCHWWGTTDFGNGEGYLVRLVVLNESIAFISNRFKATTYHISILVELGVKESWIKLFIVGPIPSLDWPIAVGQKGGICFRQTNDELVWIDLSTQIIDEIGVKGERYCYQMGIYKESLLRIGGIND